MGRSSPGIRRMVAILDFFADHPGQSFTLADLVRALKLSRSTCHSQLAGLVSSGYLYRTHDKSYVIGPRLVAIGRVANEQFSPLQVAQPEMRALADEFDAVCLALFREGDEVVVRARQASLSQLGGIIPNGARIRAWPPIAAIYYAWRSPAEAESWLEQISRPPSPELRAAMRAGTAFAREHGFSFGVRNVEALFVKDTPEQVFAGQHADLPVTVETSIRLDERYRLAYLVAPVFDVRQSVAFILGVTGFTGLLAGAGVERMGRRLREACERISEFSVRSHC